MKLIILILATVSAFAADITITVRLDDGTTQVATITGPAVSAGLDSIQQWMATQFKDTDKKTPKYKDFADLIKQGAINTVEQVAERFPSAATKAAADDIAARKAALEAQRKALLDAARK